MQPSGYIASATLRFAMQFIPRRRSLQVYRANDLLLSGAGSAICKPLKEWYPPTSSSSKGSTRSLGLGLDTDAAFTLKGNIMPARPDFVPCHFCQRSAAAKCALTARGIDPRGLPVRRDETL